MKWIIENLYLLVAAVSLIGTAMLAVYRFLGLTTENQKKKIKEWLIWACIESERGLQSGTGQLKLRQVYDMFCAVPAFGWVARIVSFAVFSEWVTEALATVKRMLVENPRLASYVYGDKAIDEVAKLWEQLKGGRE